jgi:hypothetical protein
LICRGRPPALGFTGVGGRVPAPERVGRSVARYPNNAPVNAAWRVRGGVTDRKAASSGPTSHPERPRSLPGGAPSSGGDRPLLGRPARPQYRGGDWPGGAPTETPDRRPARCMGAHVSGTRVPTSANSDPGPANRVAGRCVRGNDRTSFPRPLGSVLQSGYRRSSPHSAMAHRG